MNFVFCGREGEIRFHAFTDNFPTKEPFFVETGDAMPSRHESSDLDMVLEMARAYAARGMADFSRALWQRWEDG